MCHERKNQRQEIADQERRSRFLLLYSHPHESRATETRVNRRERRALSKDTAENKAQGERAQSMQKA